MESPKKFGASMFGFKKEDVNNYIVALGKQYADTQAALTQENEELKKQNMALIQQNQALSKKVAELEKERSFIADALLNAKQEAEKIIIDARQDAIRQKEQIEAQIAALYQEAEQEREKIHQLRQQAKTALDAYIESLANIEIE